MRDAWGGRLDTALPRLLLLPLLALNAGCEDEADDGEAGPAGRSDAEVPAEVISYSVQMSPLNDSGVTGEALLEREEARTSIRVTLGGSTEGSTHVGNLHLGGTCDSPGERVAPLPAIVIDAEGSGQSSSLVDVELESVMDDRHLIVYRGAGEAGGEPVVCGDLPPLRP